jgi:hypothetical protein
MKALAANGLCLMLVLIVIGFSLVLTAEDRSTSRTVIIQEAEMTGMVPLTEMGQELYKGQKGGLYGQGLNTPQEAHQAAVEGQSSLIVPLDPNGQPSPTGKVVLISLGMSNTTQEFSVFKKLADADPSLPMWLLWIVHRVGRPPMNGPILIPIARPGW